jgi:hypothetical protein
MIAYAFRKHFCSKVYNFIITKFDRLFVYLRGTIHSGNQVIQQYEAFNIYSRNIY